MTKQKQLKNEGRETEKCPYQAYVRRNSKHYVSERLEKIAENYISVFV